MPHLATAAYNLDVLLQRRLGQLEKCALNTLPWRLYLFADVWRRASGKPTLKLAVAKPIFPCWWSEILATQTALTNCNVGGSLPAWNYKTFHL